MSFISSFINPPHEGRISLHEDRRVVIGLPLVVNGTCRECRHNTIGIRVNSADELSELIADGTIARKMIACSPCWDDMHPSKQSYFACDGIEERAS